MLLPQSRSEFRDAGGWASSEALQDVDEVVVALISCSGRVVSRLSGDAGVASAGLGPTDEPVAASHRSYTQRAHKIGRIPL